MKKISAVVDTTKSSVKIWSPQDSSFVRNEYKKKIPESTVQTKFRFRKFAGNLELQNSWKPKLKLWEEFWKLEKLRNNQFFFIS